MFDNINQDYILIFLIFALGIYLYTRKENFACVNVPMQFPSKFWVVWFKDPSLWKWMTQGPVDKCCGNGPRMVAMITDKDGYKRYFCRQITSTTTVPGTTTPMPAPGTTTSLAPSNYLNMPALPKIVGTNTYYGTPYVSLYT